MCRNTTVCCGRLLALFFLWFSPCVLAQSTAEPSHNEVVIKNAIVMTVTHGNLKNASLLDYFLPTAVETPVWETDYTTTPSPHHPIGAKGVGESPNVGGVSAISNAVNDAFAHLGVTHMPMPHTPPKIWKVCQSLGIGT